jgi:endonuclease-8
MPEGDVVWRTAQRLDAALSGQALVAADLRWPSLATADLTGRTVLSTTARGKHILTRLSGEAGWSGRPAQPPVTLHSHLRMEGSWRIDATDSGRAPRSADVRAILATERWTATALRLGMLDLVATSDEAALVGHLGPDVLGPDWDAGAVLTTLRAQPDRTIGAALLDQRVLAGVGTFYMTETMFLMGRSPWTPVREVGGADGDGLARVVDRAYRLLHLNRDRVTQVTTGDARPGHEAFVHARSGRPCRRCGDLIRVARIAEPPVERVAFYCPTCQPGPAPTDDGRPQRPLGAPAGSGRRRR